MKTEGEDSAEKWINGDIILSKTEGRDSPFKSRAIHIEGIAPKLITWLTLSKGVVVLTTLLSYDRSTFCGSCRHRTQTLLRRKRTGSSSGSLAAKHRGEESGLPGSATGLLKTHASPVQPKLRARHTLRLSTH